MEESSVFSTVFWDDVGEVIEKLHHNIPFVHVGVGVWQGGNLHSYR